MVVLLHIFVETVILFFWIFDEQKVKKQHLFEIKVISFGQCYVSLLIKKYYLEKSYSSKLVYIGA